MSFKPDPTKPVHEVIFSRKLKTVPHPLITFENNPLSLCPAQKHLVLVLDSKLTFNKHMKHILSKVNKSIGYCVNSNRSFQDHHFCLDIIYDQSYKSSFHENFMPIQYMLLWQ